MRWLRAAAAALVLAGAMSAPALAVKPDKDPREFDGKPGWGPPPYSHHNKAPGPPPAVCGPLRLDLCHQPAPPRPEPEPEPAPEPQPPIVGPGGLPPLLPDTALP